MATLPSIGWSAYNVADSKGFWKEEGLEVQVAHLTTSEYIRKVVQNKLDFFSLPTALVGDFRNAGIPLVFLGAMDISAGGKVVIQKKNLSNGSLRGVTVGIFTNGSTTKYLLARYLKTQGLTLKDVNFEVLPIDQLTNKFVANELQAVVLFGFHKQRAINEGNGLIVAASKGDFMETHGVGLREDNYVTIPPKDLSKLFRGWVKAVQWLKDPKNWKEYHKIVNEQTFKTAPEISEKALREMLKEIIFLPPQKLRQFNQSKLPKLFSQMRRIFAREGLMKKKVHDEFTWEKVMKNQILVKTLAQVSKTPAKH